MKMEVRDSLSSVGAIINDEAVTGFF